MAQDNALFMACVSQAAALDNRSNVGAKHPKKNAKPLSGAHKTDASPLPLIIKGQRVYLKKQKGKNSGIPPGIPLHFTENNSTDQ